MEAYVTADGNYGMDEFLVFDHNALTEHQWEQLSMQIDRERIIYVERILKGEDVSDMEE